MTLAIKANKGCSGEDTFFWVRRYVLRGTELRSRRYGCPCKPYPRQLSKVSLSAVRRLRVSCRTFLCQLSKVRVMIFHEPQKGTKRQGSAFDCLKRHETARNGKATDLFFALQKRVSAVVSVPLTSCHPSRCRPRGERRAAGRFASPGGQSPLPYPSLLDRPRSSVRREPAGASCS